MSLQVVLPRLVRLTPAEPRKLATLDLNAQCVLATQNYSKANESRETNGTTVEQNLPAQDIVNMSNEAIVNRSHVNIKEGDNMTSIHTAYHLLPEARNTSSKPLCTVTQRHCDIHDFTQHVDTSDRHQYECLPAKGAYRLKICLYPTRFDQHVSGSIRRSGSWELGITISIRHALKRYPKSKFLDIGANIGMHTLVVAKLGYDVIAVEPKLNTIKRLHKSVNLNGLKSRITLVTNGISDVRNNLTLYSNGFNQGGATVIKEASSHRKETIKTIFMDDLLEVIHSGEQLVVKMDIEGSECHALVHSQRFFSSVKVNVIFMEWLKMKENLRKNVDTKLIRGMVKKLRSLGFEPRAVDPSFAYTNQKVFFRLEDKIMLKWPNDIVWIQHRMPPAKSKGIFSW